VTDDRFTVALRQRMMQRLNRNNTNDPNTYDRELMRDLMVKKLIKQKNYLIGKARKIDEEDKLGGALVQILQWAIPAEGGGHVKETSARPAGMKQSISKPAMVDILVKVWGVLRKIIERNISVAPTCLRELETFITAIQ